MVPIRQFGNLVLSQSQADSKHKAITNTRLVKDQSKWVVSKVNSEVYCLARTLNMGEKRTTAKEFLPTYINSRLIARGV